MLIKLNNISKVFPISLSDRAISIYKILSGRRPSTSFKSKSKIAVDNISISINEGERVGIIGHNGAGKTTLLQMIAGLSEPSCGNIDVIGHVSCVMTLGVGLREELTGRENIYLDGELNGKSRNDTDNFIKDIIAFVDIGDFIDYPVRTYSSGMKARLAFAMIIFIEPEILIIDEALSAGDSRFVAKASAKMKEVCARGKILLVVSHSMGSIIDMCNRCIWMDHGKIVMDGPPEKVTKMYLEAVHKNEEKQLRQKLKKRINSSSFIKGFEISEFAFIDNSGASRTIFSVQEQIKVRITINAMIPTSVKNIRFYIERMDGIKVVDCLASDFNFDISSINTKTSILIALDDLRLGKSTYQAYVELLTDSNEGSTEIAARCSNILQIDNPHYPYENPVTWAPAKWNFNEQGTL